MKSTVTPRSTRTLWLAISLAGISINSLATDHRVVGRWLQDQGFQTLEYTFRSDGRYQLDTRSSDPAIGFSFTDRGEYEATGTSMTLRPYEYFGDPVSIQLDYQIEGGQLSLTRIDPSWTEVFSYQTGSSDVVRSQEQTPRDLVGIWRMSIPNAGTNEYTLRPDGYYVLKKTAESSQFPPEFVRGRYSADATRIVFQPYSGVESSFQTDFFANTLILIRREEFSGAATGYELVPGSRAEVHAKTAEAQSFLARADWQIGTWEVRDPFLSVDITLRPDGHYVAEHHTEFLQGIVRGRYALGSRRVQWLPFPGQDIYARSNGDFGKVGQTRELDYYDGELQFIDPTAISQSVRLARKRPGSDTQVIERVHQAQAQRAQPDWQVGIWEVQDPTGWMQFTFRPDQRYIAKSGQNGIPSEVERGRYAMLDDILTLAPFSGSGQPRGFEVDLYDRQLFIAGDLRRLVVARKIPGSETEVITRTQDPSALKGERGNLLGLWTALMPGSSTELVFRDDGEFRIERCSQGQTSRDYGLYSVDLAARKIWIDSRFATAQSMDLDFYGDTVTLHGGLSAPATYQVQLGTVDAAIAESIAADVEREKSDDLWLGRVPIGSRDPNSVQLPSGNIPADPQPTRTFPNPTVFTGYQLYRRLIPGFVYFDVQGSIRSVAVVNTREWHFFPTGRVLVRFKNTFAGLVYPTTITEVSDSWGAYRITGRPTETDVLHRYADNGVELDLDRGETASMTLEDGRRHLFWGKDYQIQSEWATEQKPVPCTPPTTGDTSLLNTGLSLTSSLPPGPIGDEQPTLLGIVSLSPSEFGLRGSVETAGTIIVESASHLASSAPWRPIQTNDVAKGTFTLRVPKANASAGAAYFRFRRD